MRGRRHDHESILLRETGNNTPQPCDVGSCFLDIATNSRPYFHHRLDHLRLDLLAEQHLALFENLGDVRAQFARLRIDDLKLLLDAQCKFVEHLPSLSYWFRYLEIILQSGLTLPMNSWRICFHTLAGECTGL